MAAGYAHGRIPAASQRILSSLHKGRRTRRPQFFRATCSDCRGNSAMDEISINTTTAGDQDQPGVAGFSGTQFAVVWADHGSGNIKGRTFGVNAAPSGNE